MEEKDVNSIASAVTAALSKLNADTAAKDAYDKAAKDKEINADKAAKDIFTCPDCGATITGGIAFCQACGCPLEWEA